MPNRRDMLAGALASGLLPPSIQRALALPAARTSGSVRDVRHVVILMMENRGFDHYFGTLKGVRGFGDRHPVPLESGKPVWFQSDGTREIAPYHLDTATTSALRVPGTPHSFRDAQAAWNQGKFGHWPKYKTRYAMGHYRRADLPYQFALADAFTLCDAYHCSVTTGTDPNRIVFWSGTNADPGLRGENATAGNSEPDNLRCWIKGALPEPGYTYAGSSFTWPTIPEVLEKAGVSWRIYQDPNDNWTGAMHGGLAFESFRTARPGSPLYEKGMSHWSLEHFAQDARNGALPEVSWVLPPMLMSEHPGPSSPAQGAEFTSRVLDALTENPKTWGETVLLLTFDENDGMFDHVPPPAPPSYNVDGSLAGGATVRLDGLYFSDPARAHLLAEDTISGTVRPWGLGPRVPMVVISPWSKGGWVNSQTFDHTSVGQFLEKRFGVTVPGISPWHRAVCGDLLSAFNFVSPNDPVGPHLPDAKGSASLVVQAQKRPKPEPPATPQKPSQEPGSRLSRALPYVLHAVGMVENPVLRMNFRNDGKAGAVFQVYDRLRLDRIPRRYTVEAGRTLEARWDVGDRYDLWILGPNGFVRELAGRKTDAAIEAALDYHAAQRAVDLRVIHHGDQPCKLVLESQVYAPASAKPVEVKPKGTMILRWDVSKSGNWYDLTLKAETGFVRRFAGRLETGNDSVSDPAMG
ncbi:MAG: phospholipase C, phosphocholine-specific [Alphaproteobacteria bacterium]|nr:phospholipase C, phosphocholine-specific [Alphaproteobacteria bacterium]